MKLSQNFNNIISFIISLFFCTVDQFPFTLFHDFFTREKNIGDKKRLLIKIDLTEKPQEKKYGKSKYT
jgi:hypothetical protein